MRQLGQEAINHADSLASLTERLMEITSLYPGKNSVRGRIPGTATIEVSMCLAVPMKVTEVTDDGMAKCRIGESETYVTASVALLEAPPEPGDYVIVHAGFALRKLEPQDAEETLRLLREMIACVEQERSGVNH